MSSTEGMLILTRSSRSAEERTIRINDDIQIHILGYTGNQVRIGIEAPKNVSILRPDAKKPAPDSGR